MQNCKLEIEVKDGEILVRSEHTRLLELVQLCGVFEQIVGMSAIGYGISLEEVKSNMLDMHLESMEALTRQVIQERGWEHES